MNSVQNRETQDDELDLRLLFKELVAGLKVILFSTLLFAVAAAVYTLFIPNVYKTSTLVQVNEGGGGLSLSGGLAGLASLTGVTIGGGGGTPSAAVYTETLRSRQFLIQFAKRKGIQAEVVAGINYAQNSGTWEYDSAIYDVETKSWLFESETVPRQQLADIITAKKLKEAIVIERNKASGLLTISLESYSPHAAQQWLIDLVTEVDQEIKNKAVQESERAVAYLREKIDETQVSELHAVFYELIEQELRTIMLANVKKDYAATLIDPPIFPVKPEGPRRILIVGVAAIIGFGLACLGVLVHARLRREKF